MPDDAPAKPLEGDYDVVMLAGKTDDGDGAKVVRARPGKVETGEVRAMKEGQPLVAGEVVRLEPRKDAPQLKRARRAHGEAPRREDGPQRPRPGGLRRVQRELGAHLRLPPLPAKLRDRETRRSEDQKGVGFEASGCASIARGESGASKGSLERASVARCSRGAAGRPEPNPLLIF
jgi:hypothetical protein